MAYDEKLAARVRKALAPKSAVTEREMFGGIAFMLHGNMVVGVVEQELLARVGADLGAEALSRPHARVMDFTGKPMKGYVFVEPDGLKTAAALAGWIRLASGYVGTLPRKEVQRKPARRQ